VLQRFHQLGSNFDSPDSDFLSNKCYIETKRRSSKMNKILTITASSALALSAGIASAQESTADFYGFVIAGINNGNTTNDDTFDAAGDGNGPGRFGFIGTHDLGNGLEGGVQLEYGLSGDKDQGEAPGLRQANVHLSGDFGTVKLGSQGNPMYDWTTGVTDLFLTEVYAHGRSTDVVFRQDGAVFYTTPDLAGLQFRVGGNMEQGETTPGNQSSGLDSYTASVKYSFGNFYTSASYLNIDGGDQNPDATSVGLSATYDYGMGTIAAATTRNDDVTAASAGTAVNNRVGVFYTDPDGNPYEVIGTYNVNDALTLKGSYTDADQQGGDSSAVAVEAAYSFSSNVSAAVGYTSPDENLRGNGNADDMAAAAVYVAF
jgi:predicted porin